MKTVFMYSGQGSQYYHMGSKLFDADDTFKKHMYAMDEIMKADYGFSVVSELFHPKHKLYDAFLSLRLTHPAIFMVEYALSKVLARNGILPDYLLGCSLGEFAAAAVSGILSEADALRLIMKQVELIERRCSEGRLIVILGEVSIYHNHPFIRDNSTIAGMYGPSQFVISGAVEPMAEVKQFLKAKDILHQELIVSYGFHSQAVDPAGVDYKAYLREQAFRFPTIPFISGITGDRTIALPEDYFWDVVRKPINFIAAVETLENSIGRVEELMYIDLGTSGSLANLIKYNVKEGSQSKGFQVLSPFQQDIKKLAEVKAYYQVNKKEAISQAPPKNRRLLACVFPGQGSQKRGMGEELFKLFPALTDQASEILGYSVQELCVQDLKRQLNLTQYTQPALYVVNALSYLRLKEEEGIVPDFVAGHSLGEYNALYAAGAVDFKTGLLLVQKRGALMAKMKEGGMAAVKGLREEEIYAVIEQHGLQKIDIANYNTHNQIVLSGPKDLIVSLGPHFEAAGATLFFPLNVSGAFHSRYMLPAKMEFAQFLDQFSFRPLKIPVISNVEASFYPADNIKQLLTDQLVRPVRWAESIGFLLKQGEIDFKEVGPGDVLTKLIWSLQRGPGQVIQ